MTFVCSCTKRFSRNRTTRLKVANQRAENGDSTEEVLGPLPIRSKRSLPLVQLGVTKVARERGSLLHCFSHATLASLVASSFDSHTCVPRLYQCWDGRGSPTLRMRLPWSQLDLNESFACNGYVVMRTPAFMVNISALSLNVSDRTSLALQHPRINLVVHDMKSDFFPDHV